MTKGDITSNVLNNGRDAASITVRGKCPNDGSQPIAGMAFGGDDKWVLFLYSLPREALSNVFEAYAHIPTEGLNIF